jgi:cytochrome d ubiquinol oxidase subunit II
MPALYTPMIAMLLGLVFRGVAFEFRWRTTRERNKWDIAFAGGSLLAALAQGIALGAILQGIHVEGRHYAGGWWDWLTPFSLLTGVSLVVGYALLGATWLVMKTEGPVADRARRHAKELLIAVLIFMAGVSLWTPIAFPRIAARWFSTPNIYFLWPVPLLTALVAFMAWRWLDARRDVLPFLASIALFLLGYLGLAISTFPYLVPPTLTIWDTAAAPGSQLFMLVGTLVLLPIILGYTGLVYWIFRGRVREGETYH